MKHNSAEVKIRLFLKRERYY